jgi:hypothetical protein
LTSVQWSRVPKDQVLKYKLRCYLSAKDTAEVEHSTRETIDQSEFEDASEHEDKKDHVPSTSPVVAQSVLQQPSAPQSTPVIEPVKPTPAPVTPLATNKVQPVSETNKGQLSPRAKYKLEIEKQRLEIDRLKADLDKYRNNESGCKYHCRYIISPCTHLCLQCVSARSAAILRAAPPIRV